MTEIKDKPAGLPSTNALDGIPESAVNPNPRREIRLGANTLLALDDPPQLQETRDIVLKLRCVRRAEDQISPEADPTLFCGMRVVTAWLLGDPEPQEPTLFDEQDAESRGDTSDIGPSDGERGWEYTPADE